ncbi:chemotaxis protein CheA [Chryseosolibacter indicus]|uniref:Chemotaxis protein CheA n=1 Tax=Chryseosolibacter indicus TaxID=2782351 RepID=A0ABS5VUF4_9BACT|nr:chemotaxis protein CheA [Chryseosolibacter indicus]MBT1704519.1 chemotaxis protein CheA [Chryseosolibacter indicus]
MDSNQLRFVEDTLDLLNDLDEGLLQLEANPHATAPLEQVFRTMHTIKGAANMFGFDNIGNLAHQLESLFDLVRSNKLQVTDSLISITLQAFDNVRNLLQAKEFERIVKDSLLQEHIDTSISYYKEAIASSNIDETVSTIDKDELVTYFISVTPSIDITKDGNHPLVFIMLDLEGLGTSRTKVFAQGETIKQWHLFIATTTSLAELQSYFLFVEGECNVEYQRIATGNLIEDHEFQQCIEKFNDGQFQWEKLLEEATQAQERLKVIQTEELVEKGGPTTPVRKAQSDAIIKVDKRKIDDLLNWISELLVLQAQLSTISNDSNNATLRQVAENLEMITGRLRDTSLEIGLVPIETLVTKFKRFVRDLSKSLNKKVNFLSEGSDTEMDKDVIEMMSEPMIHLIRNAIDHGISSPEVRKAEGKSEFGTVKLKAFNSSAYVNIIISDDGKGIDKEAVLRKAIKEGVVSEDITLSEEEVFNLIFHPGLSTADKVSDISGRGVGMDVVRQKINELRGSITIKSEKGKGTAFHIKLPLSRSIIEGLLVKVADTRYVVPLNVIERIDRISYESLYAGERVNTSVLVNDELLPVLSLRKQFHNDVVDVPKTADVISISIDGKRKGIAVDKIEGKMQTVLKPLGDVYQQQDFIAGSTILGNGSLALVLDPSRLLKLEHNKN